MTQTGLNTKGYLMLADEFNCRPDESVYVGNERKDIDGGNAAGLRTVLVNRENDTKSWGQDLTVSDLTEFVTALEASQKA